MSQVGSEGNKISGPHNETRPLKVEIVKVAK